MSLLSAGPIDHIGIAVRDLETACSRYAKLLGATVGEPEVVEDQSVELVFLELPGTTRIELMAPLRDDGPVSRFLERRGEGLHHICVLVDDLERTLCHLEESQVPIIDREPRIGAGGARIAFVRPEALGGVLLELKQKSS